MTSAIILVALGAGAACTPSSHPVAGRSARPEVTASPTYTPTPIPWVAVENDYRHTETFCARLPLHGMVRYVVRNGRVTLRFRLGGLPPNSGVGVYWVNDPTRGYNIAYIRSTAAGDARQASLRIYRGGEVRGQGMQMQLYDGRVLGNLVPCL
ncbi:MAG TPA: hypothetical protein VG650_10720 [Mycobacteriales bacterium]|nr:hypothetical protein [Mycobacteriales bacterium]